MQSPTLLLVGASVRAAAFSALRAGFQPWCADLFTDRDLRQVCPAHAISSSDYPQGFVELFKEAPQAPWLYTGALENRPALLEELAHLRPLLGCSAAAVQVVRSPFKVHDILTRAGLLCPQVRAADTVPSRGRWLLKPLASAAGVGIRLLGQTLPIHPERWYLQEFVEGPSGSAIFAISDTGTSMLGITRMLVGEEWLHASPFHYCGSVGPWPLPAVAQEMLRTMGDCLARESRLRGLFGIDFVLHNGVPYPVEVNPRYTASVEVLEYATGIVAFSSPPLPLAEGISSPPLPLAEGISSPPLPLGEGMGVREKTVGKAIWFAPRQIHFPTNGLWDETLRNPTPQTVMPQFADIPEEGAVIEPGRPVLTCFAQDVDIAGCVEKLRRLASELDKILR